MKPIAFFDLDGTVRDTYGYVYPRAHQVSIFPGVKERLAELRHRGYLLAGITNQGGVAKGVISDVEVRAANQRTQELLGQAALDWIAFCPHHFESDGRFCDCKKPAVGLALDCLSALHDPTLDGSFVVGDNHHADAGLAHALGIPFIDATDFRKGDISRVLDSLQSRNSQPTTFWDDDKIAGVLVGMAIGDALGAAVEFMPRAQVKTAFPDGVSEMNGSRLWAKGEYTDDTQMALLLAESLVQHGYLLVSDIAGRFLNWGVTAKDVGVQISRVVRMKGYTEHPELSARLDYELNPTRAAGNGAVMRCAPVALFHRTSISMMVGGARRSARLTHGDPKAQSSCVLVCAAIRYLLSGGGIQQAVLAGQPFLTANELKTWERLKGIEALSEDEISSSGYTVSTVEAAFWALARSRSFEEAVVAAASLGDDADTVAAVTGAMAGAYYGYESIPERWKKCLLDQEHIRTIALQLAHHDLSRPNDSRDESGKRNTNWRIVDGSISRPKRA